MIAPHRWRQLIISLAATICLCYLTYRALFTLNLATPYAVFVSVFLLLGEAYGVFVLLLFFLQVWDSREPPQEPVLENRTVDVFVPTYNEDPQLLRATLEACSRLDYPHRTYLCDDGGTEARLNHPQHGENARARATVLKAMCAELGAIYSTRPKNEHAKAGNLNYIFEKTNGEFIVILDADHVPEPHFLSRLIGYFRDEQLGFVQTPHAFYNFDSFQARLDHKHRRYWEEGHLFYEVIQPGRNRWGCPIFAGSAAMFRRKALKEVGYIAVETITEDMHTGMRVNARGWKSMAISERLVAGQAAPDVTTFHSQRIRWGEGNLSIMAYDNPLTMRGLTWSQRFCYLGSMVHWAGGLFKVAIYLTPILMMFTGIPPVAEFTWTLALLTLVYLVASIYGVRVASNGFGSFFNGELFCMVNFWTQIRGTLRAIFWRKFQSFVVTAKRGRQAKSIWPYIRPQVALMALSVLALVWGWGRVATGISDDFLRPIIPTFWILFHMFLALVVLRRALWPEDRRFSTRHIVHLPVSYTFQGTTSGLGITMDLNEMGAMLISYQELAAEGPIRLTLYGRGEQVECDGDIRWMKAYALPGPRGTVIRGYRQGIAFRNLSPQQVDVLNRLCLHYAVPRLYADYAEGRRLTFWQRARIRLVRFLRPSRFAERIRVHLPLVLTVQDSDTPLEAIIASTTPPSGAAAVHTVTEDVSRTATAVLLPTPLPIGTVVSFLIATPLGEVRGRARAARGEPRRFAARDYQLCVLEFLEFAGDGRVLLEALINPRRRPEQDPVLKPDKAPLRTPLARPALTGVAALVPLVALELGTFRALYRDDFFLREFAQAVEVASEDEQERLQRIFQDTMSQRYPSNDRLVLLMGALARAEQRSEMDQVCMLLGPRDRRNLDLQFALAQALDNTKDHQQAEEHYQRLLRSITLDNLPLARRRQLLLAAARAAVHAGDLEHAAERFRELLVLSPQEPALRNEFAGVLLGGRKYDEAAAVYESAEPDTSGRLLLVTIYAQAGKFDQAERSCRALIKDRPDDAATKLLLADILSWKREGYSQSRAIYEQLLHANGDDPDLLLRLAQISLWSQNYAEALQRFQPLVDAHPDQVDIVKGYVDAASSAEKLGDVQRKTILAVYNRVLVSPAEDPIFLARLAWVLQRLDEVDKSTTLLDRALALNPKDPTVRRQLAGALAQAGRTADVIKELAGQELDFDALQMLVGVYVKNRDFAAAERECQRMLELRPADRKAQRLLADIWSWGKDYARSLALLEQLHQEAPDDQELLVRLAEVTLWSGDHDKALARYQPLLETHFEQPRFWEGFVNAAAGARELNPAQHKLAGRIADQALTNPTAESTLLSRLAWILHRSQDPERAERLLNRALAVKPQDPAVRRELAGVLGAFGRNQLAIELYQGLSLDAEDRYRLAELYCAEKDFPAAQQQLQTALKEKPSDARVMRLLADVLSWKQDYAAALALFEKLVRDNPGDLALALRLAEVTLWSGAASAALDRYQAVLETRFDLPEAWPGYVNAAANTARLNARQADLALRIADRIGDGGNRDPVLLTRLAWVLVQAHKPDRAALLLDHAMQADVQDPKLRRELAGVLAAAGRTKQALALYDGLVLEVEDRRRLAGIYAAAKDYAAAEDQCRAILREQPDDQETARLLADVLSWHGAYKEALAQLDELMQADPDDVGLMIRSAEVLLWSRDYEAALGHYQALLDADFERPSLWPGFVDAAGGAASLKPEHVRMAVRIQDQIKKIEPANALFVIRLAWLLHRGQETARANRLLDQLIRLRPLEPAARRELAGVLAGAGNPRQALKLYEGLTLGLDDRYHLAELYAAANDFASAETQCRALLRERPQDLPAARLLASVLCWKKDFRAARALLEPLAQANSTDLGLARQLAEVTLWSGDYEQARSHFQTLLEAKIDQPEAWHGFIDAAASAPTLSDRDLRLAVKIAEKTLATGSRDVLFLARLAWVLHAGKQGAQAKAILDRAAALDPREPGLRRELAGTLAAVGDFMAALRMYENLTLDLEDRYRLVGITASAERHALAAAEEHPDAPADAQLLSSLAKWKQTNQETVAQFEKLAADRPQDQGLRIRLAEVTLWSGAFSKALARYQALLEENPEQRGLWHGYVDAAASTPVVPESRQRAQGIRLADALVRSETQAEYLSRLAWVLFQLKETGWVARLLDRALALKPPEPSVRRELAGMLAAAGKAEQALEMYQGLALTPTDRLRIAEIHAAAHRFDAAETELRALLQARPQDTKARQLLGDVLSWNKKYVEAATIYHELQEHSPNDPALAVRVAEIALWSGQYDDALEQFYRLLELDDHRSALWPSYIDAAASARTVPEKHRRLVERIAGESLKAGKEDATFLARTAWVLRRLKEPERATGLLQRAVRLDPGARPVRQQLAETLSEQGAYAEAEQHFRILLQH
jgi:tetratricopeptide (TPR) repeat protein/cellulose synthase/poly-beta-1,6-N-acetylglucosamine synthase-like glycosyltransferase